MKISEFIKNYISETSDILQKLDIISIYQVLQILLKIKEQKGRIFFLGIGGGAETASHATNDFNKIAEISTICLSDNAGVLTALANDEGWESIFRRQLEMHKLNQNDCIFIYSVSGGNENVSSNIISAINYAKNIGAKIVGVVGKEDGATAKNADACVITPCPNPENRTPHTEDFQLVIDHLLSNIISQISKGTVENA